MTPKCQVKSNARKEKQRKHPLFRGRRVLGNGLGAFRDGVLGQLTGQNKTDTVVVRQMDPCQGQRITHEVWISRDEIVDFLL